MMTADRWQLVKDSFAECLSVSPESREEFLSRKVLPDDIRDEVSRLLRNLSAAESGYLEPPEAVRRAFPFAQMAIRPGEILSNRFRVERLIGSGGMGEVYEVFDQELQCQLAVKAFRAMDNMGADGSARFRRELLLARRVTHPNVCRLFDLSRHEFPWGDIEFLTMELLPGETLAAVIRKKGTLLADEAKPILHGILLGLQAVHAAGIVHRDLKPGNVMVDSSLGRVGRVSLMDFGLALLEDHRSILEVRTATGYVAGTPAYLSPEQLAGEPVTAATDCYAFGLVWFEMLTGRRPAVRSEFDSPADSLSSQNIPKGWLSGIRACLSQNPVSRPHIADLLRQLDSPDTPVAPEAGLGRKHPITRRQVLAGAAIASGAGALALAGPIQRLLFQSAIVPAGSLVLVTPVSNLTDETNLGAITELLRNQLSQSVRLNELGAGALKDALRQMGKADSQSARDLREAAWRLNAAVMVFGSAARVGTDYVLNMQLEIRGNSPEAPRAKLAKSFFAPDAPALMRSVRDAAVWVRDGVGESAKDIAEFDKLPPDVTTPSWEALDFYARGERLAIDHRPEDALLLMESALQSDPAFTLAALRRADLLMNRLRQDEGLHRWRTAIQMLGQRSVTRREELHARGMFAYDTGDFRDADRQFSIWALEYPNDPAPLIFRAVPLTLYGHADEARSLLEKAVVMASAGQSCLLQLINSNLVLGDTRSARNWIDKLRSRGGSDRVDLKTADAAYREGDFKTAMAAFRMVAEGSNPRAASLGALHEGMLWIEASKAAVAAETLDRFLKRPFRAEEDPERAVLLAALAWAHWRSGNTDAAVQTARDAAGLQSGYVILTNAGTVLARAGAIAPAEEIVRHCGQFDDMPAYQLTSLKIQGEIQRHRGRRDEALATFRQAAALEPPVAYREYLIDALDPSDPERLDLCRKVVENPWMFFRDPNVDSPGVLAASITALLASGRPEPRAAALQRALQALG